MKRKIITLLLAISVSSALCAPVMAADDATLNGFYDIGTAGSVTITPYAGSTQVSATEKDVDSDDTLEKFYENSDRLSVTFASATKDEQYGVILVDGSGLPTKDTEIYYINQETAGSTSVDFNVYPKLPTESTDMTLYISSSEESFSLVSVPVSYAANVSIEETPSHTPGDVNDDGDIDVADVILIRKYITGGYEVEIIEDAADVNNDGDIDVADVILIRKYITGGYGVELK